MMQILTPHRNLTPDSEKITVSVDTCNEQSLNICAPRYLMREILQSIVRHNDQDPVFDYSGQNTDRLLEFGSKVRGFVGKTEKSDATLLIETKFVENAMKQDSWLNNLLSEKVATAKAEQEFLSRRSQPTAPEERTESAPETKRQSAILIMPLDKINLETEQQKAALWVANQESMQSSQEGDVRFNLDKRQRHNIRKLKEYMGEHSRDVRVAFPLEENDEVGSNYFMRCASNAIDADGCNKKFGELKIAAHNDPERIGSDPIAVMKVSPLITSFIITKGLEELEKQKRTNEKE